MLSNTKWHSNYKPDKIDKYLAAKEPHISLWSWWRAKKKYKDSKKWTFIDHKDKNTTATEC